jgi:protein-S-isoprenylcysteine O-methyltransferase Ste14
MEKRLSRFGVGPRTFLPTVAYGLVAWAATRAWPDACLLRWPPYAVFATAGGILLALGVPMWLTGAITVMRAYHRDQLVTSGVFGLVRNPVYSAMIVLNLPGIALLTRSWPLFLMPLVAYTVFKLLIHREDEYLERRFGQAYLDYRARVNEVIPLPRFWSSGK